MEDDFSCCRQSRTCFPSRLAGFKHAIVININVSVKDEVNVRIVWADRVYLSLSGGFVGMAPLLTQLPTCNTVSTGIYILDKSEG